MSNYKVPNEISPSRFLVLRPQGIKRLLHEVRPSLVFPFNGGLRFRHRTFPAQLSDRFAEPDCAGLASRVGALLTSRCIRLASSRRLGRQWVAGAGFVCEAILQRHWQSHQVVSEDELQVFDAQAPHSDCIWLEAGCLKGLPRLPLGPGDLGAETVSDQCRSAALGTEDLRWQSMWRHMSWRRPCRRQYVLSAPCQATSWWSGGKLTMRQLVD